ncbi:hypothetical protein pdam_00024889 [Pocillopora damicornis]|uniref:Uncharacterized protein n=1 Tax=Pocillopora damicornis TaxID=46731 RepID=A0A3M6UXK0_POCDA|nr:hypothetical protein pdam_00024889 [Pocillopora damicornis]
MWSVSYVHSVSMDAWFTQHNKRNCSKRNASSSFQSQIYEIKRRKELNLVLPSKIRGSLRLRSWFFREIK